MTLSKLSDKQKEVFRWCHRKSTRDVYDAIICDGAVRSGKTICMIASFIHWAMRFFDGAVFGICGKTVQSAERNILMPLQELADVTAYYQLSYTRSTKLLSIRSGERTNSFYIFGGRDESSYMLIQGITLSGVLFDEVALMPRSFVEQAMARTLSVPTAKLWFNCNPESPNHWFYGEWIQGADAHKALHLHFLMTDNPILTPEAIQKAESRFSGVFYDRYILGLWTMAEGRIYDFFRRETYVHPVPESCDAYYISMDYGTQNPTAMLLWGRHDGEWYATGEYYHSGRDSQAQKTDEEYYAELERIADGKHIQAVVIDPSAASFITLIRRRGRFRVILADNAVLDGIRNTATALQSGKVKLTPKCENTLREIESYVWDDKAAQRGEDKPLKVNDHGCDALRYFVQTIIAKPKAKVADRRRLGIY